MSVAQTELLYRKSTTGSSDGGAMTTVEIPSGVNANLWPDVSDIQRIAGLTRYKKFFIFNNSGSDALMSPSIWVYRPGDNLDLDQIGIGWDWSADNDSGQGNMTEFAADALVELSSSAPDTRTCLLFGLDNLAAPLTELVTLAGTTPVLTSNEFSLVFGSKMSATGSQTVTLKEGSGGTTRGVIGPTKAVCWLWLDAPSKGSGLRLPNLAPQASYGIWGKQVLAAALPGARPATTIYGTEEN